MNQFDETRAGEITKALRHTCDGCNPTPCCEFEALGPDAADLIESLTADAASYKQVKKCLSDEGFSDLPSMIARFKQVMRDSNDIEMSKDERIESLIAENAEQKVFIEKWCKGEDHFQEVVAQLDCAKSKIASLTAQLAASQRKTQDARNELCQKCGRYREAHNGACNGCRWKE